MCFITYLALGVSIAAPIATLVFSHFKEKKREEEERKKKKAEDEECQQRRRRRRGTPRQRDRRSPNSPETEPDQAVIILKVRSADFLFLKLNPTDSLYLDLTSEAETKNPFDTVPEAGVKFPAGIKVPTTNREAQNMASMKPEECVRDLPAGAKLVEGEHGQILLGRISGNEGEDVD